MLGMTLEEKIEKKVFKNEVDDIEIQNLIKLIIDKMHMKYFEDNVLYYIYSFMSIFLTVIDSYDDAYLNISKEMIVSGLKADIDNWFNDKKN